MNDIVAEPTDNTPPAPKVLPKELVMQLENLSLKMQNVQLQLQVMNVQLSQALEAKNNLQKEMELLRQKVIEDHGVDVATANITPEGIVKPAQAPSQPRS